MLPSNEGRGYVLRRIMRRAMRHAHLIGSRRSADVSPCARRSSQRWARPIPNSSAPQALITETLKLEEDRFRDTLARGLKLLDEATGSLSKGDTLAGDVAFKLYDTFGFPLDLTEDALRARGIHVDTTGFDAAMKKQREDARKAWAVRGKPPPTRNGSRCARNSAPPNSSATTPKMPKAPSSPS